MSDTPSSLDRIPLAPLSGIDDTFRQVHLFRNIVICDVALADVPGVFAKVWVVNHVNLMDWMRESRGWLRTNLIVPNNEL